MFAELIDKLRLEIVSILSIDIDLLFQKIDEANQHTPKSHNPLDEERKFLLCLYLRGYSQDDIIREYQSLGLTIENKDISNRIRNVRDGIKKLIGHDFDWTLIINYLLEHGYKIADRSYDDCLSLGGRYFLSGYNLERTKATQQFLVQDYNSALAGFLQQWDEGDCDVETQIYLNNSWLLANQTILEQVYGIASFKLYKIAVVIPVLHNNGAVAQNLLKGIALLQLKINLALNNSDRLYHPLAEDFGAIEPFKFNNRAKFGLLIYLAKDDRNLEYSSSNTATAIKQARDIMGVIGHYSSETTAKALKTYATSNIPLITASATSDNLPGWSRASNVFYRVTTKDEIQAKTLAEFVDRREPKAKLAIIYNSRSDYCCSFRNSFLKNFSGELVSEYDNLSTVNYDELRTQVTLARECKVNVVLLIPDGGIHLSSLAATGSIIRQILAYNCWLIGGATLVHKDTLEWVREAFKEQTTTKGLDKIVISSPWFPEAESDFVARQFCEENQLIWQESIDTWREGTAYDSALMLAQALDKFNSQPESDRHNFGLILQEFKQNSSCKGITGNLQFNSHGDRLDAPVRLVGIVRERDRNCDRDKYRFRSIP